MADEDNRALVAGLAMLSRRELTTRQLRERLARKGFSPAALDQAIDRLTRERRLDDARTARLVARTELLVKHRGPYRVRRQLEALGVDEATIDDTLASALESADMQGLIDRALDRRLRSPRADLHDPASFRRIHAQLVRQGFSPSAVVTALKARRARSSRGNG